MQSQEQDPLNKLIIQMLLQGAVSDKPTWTDSSVDRNYQKGFDDANSGKNFPSAKVVKQDSRSTTNGNKTNGTFKTIHDLE